jgi:hypothetical protein
LTHYTDINLLIVKLMPSPEYDAVAAEMGNAIRDAVLGMGVPKPSFRILTSTKFRGATSSQEADGAFMPRFRDKHNDWPTVAIECGLSESLRRLGTDAAGGSPTRELR